MSVQRDALIFALNTSYAVEKISADDTYKITLEVEGGRIQLVFVAFFDFVYTVFSPIAPYSDGNLAHILSEVVDNSTLGISVIQGMVVVTNSVTFSETPNAVELQVLHDWIGTIAEEADNLESILSKGQDNF